MHGMYNLEKKINKNARTFYCIHLRVAVCELVCFSGYSGLQSSVQRKLCHIDWATTSAQTGDSSLTDQLQWLMCIINTLTYAQYELWQMYEQEGECCVKSIMSYCMHTECNSTYFVRTASVHTKTEKKVCNLKHDLQFGCMAEQSKFKKKPLSDLTMGIIIWTNRNNNMRF